MFITFTFPGNQMSTCKKLQNMGFLPIVLDVLDIFWPTGRLNFNISLFNILEVTNFLFSYMIFILAYWSVLSGTYLDKFPSI